MIEARSTEILIEPTDKVVETLRLAVLDMGLEEFLKRTGARGDILEKWMNGEEWVPVAVVREACEINRTRPEIPSHFRVLSECTSGAQVRITARETPEKVDTAVAETAKSSTAEILAKGAPKPGPPSARYDTSSQVAKFALALFFVPLLGAVMGYWLYGILGAAAGAVFSYLAVALLTFLSLALSAKKSRTS